ncbi:MAG: tetratricopeptide repeat protein [Bacteroidales bacterium]|nr:tetratricopeptide repeat protein [Bacteroidales bacterium]
MKKYLFTIFCFVAISACAQNVTCDQLVNQGFELLGQGNFNLAIEKYRDALKINSKKLEAHYGLGVAYSAICLQSGGSCDSAINHFLEADKIKSGYRFTYRNIAICFIRNFQYEKAIEYCSKAIKQDKNDGESYFYRGFSYIKLGKKEKGCEDLKKALEMGYALAKIELEKYCR